MQVFGEKRYNDLNTYLRTRFGTKVYKLALSASAACPNRDGTCGFGGCIFCSEGGSGDFAAPIDMSAAEQIAWAKERLRDKLGHEFDTARYIAYFQSYTNTYGDLTRLERIFAEAAAQPDICALSIGTRPDCVGKDVIDMLKRVKAAAGNPVWVELGLQTIHEDTARFIRRGYALPVFDDAVERLRAAGLEVIVHVILGLPGETAADMLETVKYVGACDIQGIKLQLLHVMKGTELGRMYEAGEVCPAGAVSENRRIVNDPADNEKTEMKSGHRYLYISSPEEYIGILTDALELLPQHIVIHRLTGDAPHESLLFPRWSANKRLTLNGVIREMKLRDTMQGRLSDRAQAGDRQQITDRQSNCTLQ